MLVTEHVSIVQLPVSQTNVSSMFLSTRHSSAHTAITKHACTFIALIVGDEVLRMSSVRTVSVEDLSSIATDAVINFPAEVNRLRKNEMYGLMDAFSIIRSVNVCGEYDI